MKRKNSILGFEYELDRKSIILQTISMTKENSSFDDDQLANLISITSKKSVKYSKENLIEQFGKMDYVDEIPNEYNGAFYKFIDKKTYEDYISKGKFQLGSLKYYRGIERIDSRDEKEGYSNIIIDSMKRQIFISVISGFDQYILCGTHDINMKELMKNKFGGYLIKINNIKTFANNIKKAIGAKSWSIDKVKYTNYKALRKEIEVKDLNGVSPNLSIELFNILQDMSERPSVFSKPISFIDEQELRLSFKMSRNVRKKLNFDNLGLLNEIEIIKL